MAKKNFDLIARVTNFGQQVIKVVIAMEKEVFASSIDRRLFDVAVISENPNDHSIYYDGKRKITNIYVSDTYNGTPKKSGCYIMISLLYGQKIEGASTVGFDTNTNKSVLLDYAYTLTQLEDIIYEGNVVVAKEQVYQFNTIKDNIIDNFIAKRSISGLHYREYTPTFDGENKALIIWLHGAGEGGDDNLLQIVANKGGSAFAQRKIQKLFKGAYVVAPQCPTYWIPEAQKTGKDVVDYTQKILDLILELTVHHLDIDENRIYIGGCSMGGYQTWKTIIAKPKLFAGAFPICPAYLPTRKEVLKIKDIPIWLVHSEDDPLVPVENSILAYERLKRVGGKAIVTIYPNIVIEGNNVHGHHAWIPALNNYPSNDNGLHLFDWLAKQVKNKAKEVTKEPKKKKSLFVSATAALTGVSLLTFTLLKRKTKKK